MESLSGNGQESLKMPQVIAGAYELKEKIGAGGGGVVYLGRHIRLDKQVVLKADKRTLSIGTEALRREVDLLKQLSHTYIPQVYDFIQEDGVVYTVMDYIQGESLDRLLARQELPTQAKLIRWACQLLEALVYLHARPPYGILHGDIKPANIMLKPDGDVCLIDFNIALALGEEGAVKVGFSRGYASPEHYGADYLAGNQSAAVGDPSVFRNSSFFRFGSRRANSDKFLQKSRAASAESAEGFEETEQESGSETTEFAGGSERTERDDGSGKTEVLAGSIAKNAQNIQRKSIGSTTEGDRGILLDVRSDIYSLGATLYHMLSGQKPPQDARKVKPLERDVCSAEVSRILQKAMAPQPRERYQSAEDMLADFRRLHRQDKRAVRHRRRIAAWTAALTGFFLAGGASAFIGLKQLEQRQSALALAEYSANALTEGDVKSAIELALKAIPVENGILDTPVTAEAQKALTDALGVYDLSEGFHPLGMIPLPGAPFHMDLSPDGTRLAVVYAYETAVFQMADQSRITALPVQNSALSDCFFVDNNRIVYAGAQGITAYDLDTEKTLWTGEEATTRTLSVDRRLVAAVNRDENKVIVYRTADGARVSERSFEGRHLKVPVNDIFADANDNIFCLNEDGSILAVSFHDGSVYLLNLLNPEEDRVLYEETDYQGFSGGFCGKYFAYTAEKSDETTFGLVDLQEASFAGGFSSQDSLILQADEKGIYLASGNLLVKVDTDTLEEREIAYTGNASITGFSVGPEYILTVTEDGSFSFYDSGAHRMSVESSDKPYDFTLMADTCAVLASRNEPSVRLLALEDHKDAWMMSYDAGYIHDEARVSGDGSTVMFFGYQDFRIYDMTGNLIAEEKLPDAGQIYDQQFRREEQASWLEVIWYDGTKRCYSAADGTIISEEKGEAPSRDLYEEFFTDQYRIASSLHTAPEAYDRKSGRLVATLEKDSYLTYVTQAGDYIITEYISSAGERYGILLDRRLQKLAVLPGLCDVLGDTLVFDYPSGNLRKCKLYSLEELIELGNELIYAK